MSHTHTSACAARALIAACLLTGCYHGTARTIAAADVRREPGWVLVDKMHLVPQTDLRDCGAAALAMMLGHWSLPISKDEILRSVPMDPAHGIAAGALRDLAVRKGMNAFLFVGELADLFNEIGLDRPVLVGLVQRYGDRAISHYEVVAGVNRATRRVLLMDPGHGLREDTFEGFAEEWTAAGRPTLVIIPS